MNEQNRPTKQVLIDYEERQSLEQATALLETIVAKLKEQGKFTFKQGETEIEIQPSGQIQTEIKYEVKGDKHSFEIELEWIPDKLIKKWKFYNKHSLGNGFRSLFLVKNSLGPCLFPLCGKSAIS